MAQLTGLSALTAVLQHEMGSHVEDLERQLLEAVEREAKLQRAFDDVCGDFLGLQGDMASMARALRERIYPMMSDECKRTFDSYQLGFWYILQCAQRNSKDPMEEGSDDSDEDPEAEEIANDPIQWPMFNGRYFWEV